MNNHDKARIIGPFVLAIVAIAVVVWLIRGIFVPSGPMFADEAHVASDRSGEDHPEQE